MLHKGIKNDIELSYIGVKFQMKRTNEIKKKKCLSESEYSTAILNRNEP